MKFTILIIYVLLLPQYNTVRIYKTVYKKYIVYKIVYILLLLNLLNFVLIPTNFKILMQ